MTHELETKMQQGLDVVLNSQANCLVMGCILTAPNGGIIPSRSAYLESVQESEIIL